VKPYGFTPTKRVAVPYETIKRAPDEVLNALHREGGELSFAELVLATRLPYDVVVTVVKHLKEKGEVEIHKGSVADLGFVHLR
jgi:predicted methyltransferase